MKKNIFLNYSKEDLLKSFFLSQQYLDQYFLKNKWIGLINVIFFFIFSIGLFLYFLFLFIGEYFFQNHFNNLYYRNLVLDETSQINNKIKTIVNFYLNIYDLREIDKIEKTRQYNENNEDNKNNDD